MLSTAPCLKRIQPSELQAFAPLARETFKQGFAEFFPPELLQDYVKNHLNDERIAEQLCDPQNIFMWISNDASIVGYIKIIPHATQYFEFLEEDVEHPVKPCFLERFYLLDSAKGSGIAMRAMNELLVWIKANTTCESVYLTVYEHNLRAQRFYEKVSFHKIGMSIYPFSDSFKPRDFILCIPLSPPLSAL